MFFKIKWSEPRIEVNETSFDVFTQSSIEGGMLPIAMNNLRYIWIPDVEIYGMNKFQVGKILKPMSSLMLDKNSMLRYSARVNMIISCHMEFENYPFDSHQCHIRSGSYSNHIKIVNCTSKFGYDANEKQRSLQYSIDMVDLPSKYHTYFSSGRDWATCGFSIELKRRTTQILVQVYGTSITLVVVSWLSFTINPSAIPGRMGMLVTVFLMLINIFMSVKNNSPISCLLYTSPSPRDS